MMVGFSNLYATVPGGTCLAGVMGTTLNKSHDLRDLP